MYRGLDWNFVARDIYPRAKVIEDHRDNLVVLVFLHRLDAHVSRHPHARDPGVYACITRTGACSDHRKSGLDPTRSAHVITMLLSRIALYVAERNDTRLRVVIRTLQFPLGTIPIPHAYYNCMQSAVLLAIDGYKGRTIVYIKLRITRYCFQLLIY